MVIDAALAIIFLGSAFLLWYRVSLRLPELIAIPDQVITERLHEDSARLRLFLLHLKKYYKEERHKEVFWIYLSKILYKTHLFLMRMDNWVVGVLRNARQNGEGVEKEVKEPSGPEYWKKLQESNSSIITKKKQSVEEVKNRSSL